MEFSSVLRCNRWDEDIRILWGEDTVSTIAKFKSYRRRRAELAATRVMQRRDFQPHNDTTRMEMLLYTNRIM